MDFCNESDYYISLYIDGMLDPETKTEFEKHICNCNECAMRLKEVSELTKLCRESDETELPQNFSASLHDRLMKVSEKEKESKGRLIKFNKKLIAGLSTAAVLVVSLLAYSLIPDTNQSGHSATISYDTEVRDSVSDSTERQSTAQKENAVTDNAVKSTSQDTARTAIKPSESKTNKSTDTKLSKPKASVKKYDVKSRAKSGSGNVASSSRKTKDESEKAAVYSMKMAELPQYFSNTAELNLKITGDNGEKTGAETLKALMQEVGAREVVSDSETMGVMAQNDFVEYTLSLDSFDKIVKEAAEKYGLELSIKLPVTKKDVTVEYNELSAQRDQLDQKIDDAEKKGDDTSALKEERNNLSQEMDEIVNNSDMITVRIFFVDK
ncbi:MAG TPA: zf-HC2 domain-containing protein [Ruminiclostridium sp.]|nr:zf-HC2 domain-containing protein [Ruminiclostridium sp.]